MLKLVFVCFALCTFGCCELVVLVHLIARKATLRSDLLCAERDVLLTYGVMLLCLWNICYMSFNKIQVVLFSVWTLPSATYVRAKFMWGMDANTIKEPVSFLAV